MMKKLWGILIASCLVGAIVSQFYVAFVYGFVYTRSGYAYYNERPVAFCVAILFNVLFSFSFMFCSFYYYFPNLSMKAMDFIVYLFNYKKIKSARSSKRRVDKTQRTHRKTINHQTIKKSTKSK